MEDEVISALFGLILMVFLKQQKNNNMLLLHLLRRRWVDERQVDRRRVETDDRGLENGNRVVMHQLYFSPAGLPYPNRKARQQWMKVRSKDWWDRIVLTEFTDVEWRENFRMTRTSFMKLCGLVEGFMSPEEVTVLHSLRALSSFFLFS